MRQVWKCDFCMYYDDKPDAVINHEPVCSFNKATKHCYTCKHSREDGYEDHIAGCDIGEDTFRGEEEGNCPGWVYEYLEEDRDNKISDILK